MPPGALKLPLKVMAPEEALPTLHPPATMPLPAGLIAARFACVMLSVPAVAAAPAISMFQPGLKGWMFTEPRP
jgi:hypothetical protein